MRAALGIATHVAFAAEADEFCRAHAAAFGTTRDEVVTEIVDPVSLLNCVLVLCFCDKKIKSCFIL